MEVSVAIKQGAAFKALADPTRRRLIRLLNRSAHSAGGLTQSVSMSPAALPDHLTRLKAADLVRTERRGQSIVCSANATVFEKWNSYTDNSAHHLLMG